MHILDKEKRHQRPAEKIRNNQRPKRPHKSQRLPDLILRQHQRRIRYHHAAEKDKQQYPLGGKHELCKRKRPHCRNDRRKKHRKDDEYERIFDPHPEIELFKGSAVSRKAGIFREYLLGISRNFYPCFQGRQHHPKIGKNRRNRRQTQNSIDNNFYSRRGERRFPLFLSHNFSHGVTPNRPIYPTA